MAAKDSLGGQFSFSHEKLGRGEHRLMMSSGETPLAYVDFSHHTDELSDPKSRIEVGYLKTMHEEGRGHGRRIMEHLYNRYPKSFVDWGMTIHPAATKLAQDFENKYYDRTAYEQDDEDGRSF